MASPVADARTLPDLEDWELVALKTPEADVELKNQCHENAARLCGARLAEGKLRPKQDELIDEMKRSGNWRAEVESRGSPTQMNRPDDLVLTVSKSGEPFLRDRLYGDLQHITATNSALRVLSEPDRDFLVAKKVAYLWREEGRRTLTKWLLAEEAREKGGTNCIGYARSALINEAITFIKKNPSAVSKPLPLEGDEGIAAREGKEIGDDADRESGRPEEILLARNEVKVASVRMRPRYWEVLRLRYRIGEAPENDEERSDEEIAAILRRTEPKMTEENVRVRSFRARQQLRVILDEMRGGKNGK